MTDLAGIREALAGYAAAFDPAALAVAVAEQVLAESARIEAIAASVKAQAAARVAESARWAGPGARSAADALARRTGVSPSQARRTLDRGRRLAEQPAVRRAAAAGELSPDAQDAITDAVHADPDAAERLVAKAAGGNLAELRRDCLDTKAKADPDPHATRRRIHAGRRFWTGRDAEGAGLFGGRGPIEDIAELRHLIGAARDELFTAARTSGQRPTPDTLDYDALLLTLRRGAGHLTGTDADPGADLDGPDDHDGQDGLFNPDRPDGPDPDDGGPGGGAPAPRPRRGSLTRSRTRARGRWGAVKVIVRVDHAALVRGHAEPGETCEIAGLGPVPAATISDMLDDDAFLALVTTRAGPPQMGEYVHTVAHLGRRTRIDLTDPDILRDAVARHGITVASLAHTSRRATAHQHTALQWLTPLCTAEGCGNPRTEIDHRTNWADTRITATDNLDPLCPFHHDLKTHHGWALTHGTGARPFVPPEDPRHPSWRGSAAS